MYSFSYSVVLFQKFQFSNTELYLLYCIVLTKTSLVFYHAINLGTDNFLKYNGNIQYCNENFFIAGARTNKYNVLYIFASIHRRTKKLS